jgi:pectinesterase
MSDNFNFFFLIKLMDTKRRYYMGASGALIAASTLPSCALLTMNRDYAAIVDPMGISTSNSGDEPTPRYRTIQQALDAAPAAATSPWKIFLMNGRYYEKLSITKSNIQLIGENRSQTIISFDAYAGQMKPTGDAVWGTAGCATLMILSTDFQAQNLTIENGFDYLANDVKSPNDPSFIRDPQAVALMTSHGADRCRFERINIAGYQDTLFVNVGRSYFKHCVISGNVDFIFGAGQSVFNACDIVSRPRKKPNIYPIGYLTAPSTQMTDQFGLVFLRCALRKENVTVPAHSTALGRPWHPPVSRADGRYADPDAIGCSVFIECDMDDHITSEAWWTMTGLQKSGPERTVFYPQDSRFFEYKSKGAGAYINSQRRQLSDAEATEYTLPKLFGNWAYDDRG